jgi:3-hydroxyacyl-CoA dehydrogenase
LPPRQAFPFVLLDIAGTDGDRNGPAKAGLERAQESAAAAFMDPARAAVITLGNLEDDLAKARRLRPHPRGHHRAARTKQALYARLEPLSQGDVRSSRRIPLAFR